MSLVLRGSMTLRLTLLLASIALFVSCAAGAMLFWALAKKVEQQDMVEVGGKLELVSHLVNAMGSLSSLPELGRTLDTMLAGHPHMRVWIVDDQKNVIYGSDLPVSIVRLRPDKVFLTTADNVEMYGRSAPANPGFFPGGSVVVAIDKRPAGNFLAGYGTALIAICAFWVGLTGLLAAWAVRRTLCPIEKLSAQAARIRPGNLTLRLDVSGMDEELRGLAASFNRTLDRLQAAYEQMEAFNANVAHEMRTPLTTMISGTQIILSSNRSSEELRETLTSNLEELEELKALVNDMLFLARADAGELATDVSMFALRPEIDKVADYYEASLEQAQLNLATRGNCEVLANPGLVRRALANLISNAVRATPPGETITVECSRSSAEVHISVRNPGRSIERSDLPFIFDRFYRGNGDRNARTDGYGLGLAIVSAIARMHRGTAYAISSEGETRIGFSIADDRMITKK
jgi:two-component system heavy metal sensor histidine kinase CusS